MINRLIKSLQKGFGQIFVDLGDISNTVFLSGSGRSGTTWLEEIINYDNSFRVMFEPFHSLKIDLIKGWNYRQYLRPENKEVRYIEPAKKILSGKIRSPWIDKYNKRHYARKRLIKDIRSNLLLKWIKANFKSIPIVLLLRHPCAVANSKIKLGWETHLDDFLIQQELMIDFLGQFKEQIESSIDIFDKHIFMWCIENFVPLKQFDRGEVLVLFYENICIEPLNEVENIFSFIGESVSPEIFKRISKASSESRKDSAINSGDNLISSWRKDINNKQIRRAVEILTIFGLQKIYAEEDLPLVSGRDALRLF